jgi:hypothetical protein
MARSWTDPARRGQLDDGRKEGIEAAKADWKAGRFNLLPGDTVEFIPLPA